MKISQVNNSQPNFKGGIVALKGAAEMILKDRPQLANRVVKGLIKLDLPNHDYFLFSTDEYSLEREVGEELHKLKKGAMHIIDPFFSYVPELTMEQLIRFGNCMSS